jgi:hypothetical protein
MNEENEMQRYEAGVPTPRPSEEDRRRPRQWPEEQDTLCAVALFDGMPHVYVKEPRDGGFGRIFGASGPEHLSADTQFGCWIVLNLAELLYMINQGTEGEYQAYMRPLRIVFEKARELARTTDATTAPRQTHEPTED